MNNKDFILNKKNLAKSKKRSDSLEILEVALSRINTDKVIRKNISVKGSVLKVKQKVFTLDEFNKVYIVGFGKASCEAASTLEKILKDNLSGGIVISNSVSTCEVVDSYIGTHPKPSNKNVKASQYLVELSKELTEKDLVIVIVSGGGSALLCWPESECEQGTKLYEAFLKSGGTIRELNTVRKHISKLKGGGLAKELFPAKVLGLVFSDVPGGHYEMVASGPTYYDQSSTKDAQEIIDRYELGKFELYETPKDHKWFDKVSNIPFLSNKNALMAMKEKAVSLGYEAIVITDNFYGGITDLHKKMISQAKPGTVVIGGGEASLAIPKDIKPGKGGRNSHSCMLMLTNIKPNQVFASLASDGIDNSSMAGAIVDMDTKKEITKKNISITKHADNFDSYTLLEKTKDLIKTGPTRSNVSDLYLLLTE